LYAHGPWRVPDGLYEDPAQDARAGRGPARIRLGPRLGRLLQGASAGDLRRGGRDHGLSVWCGRAPGRHPRRPARRAVQRVHQRALVDGDPGMAGPRPRAWGGGRLSRLAGHGRPFLRGGPWLAGPPERRQADHDGAAARRRLSGRPTQAPTCAARHQSAGGALRYDGELGVGTTADTARPDSRRDPSPNPRPARPRRRRAGGHPAGGQAGPAGEAAGRGTAWHRQGPGGRRAGGSACRQGAERGAAVGR
jgi:hypothetical protein